MRRGHSLVELLVALVLFAVIAGGVADVVARQWRLHAALDARRDARAQLVAAADALRPALRMAAVGGDSLAGADLAVLSDTLIELRATIGASVACAVVDSVTIDLPPSSVVAPALAWWISAPQPGDVALVHDDAAAAGRWLARGVVAVGATGAACAGSPLVRPAESALARPRLRLAAPVPRTIRAGAPVRLARRVRWLHYRASDGRWYLGEREWDGAAWTVTQPVAGPLRPPGARGGLAVAAFDSAGGVVPPGAVATRRVARVDVVLRADVPIAGGARGRRTIDTLAFTVAPRNGG